MYYSGRYESTGSDLVNLWTVTKSVLETVLTQWVFQRQIVSVEGDNKVRVEMPGVDDGYSRQADYKTAQLRFLLADGTQIMNGNDIKDASFEALIQIMVDRLLRPPLQAHKVCKRPKLLKVL